MSAATVEDVLEQIGRLNRALVSGPAPWRLLIGGRGVGKTTCICKWLTREVLREGREARVKRLSAPAGDELALLCEALNMRQEFAGKGGFIDAPGSDRPDARAVGELLQRVHDELGITDYETYVVLNAAYETAVLRKHLQAFSCVEVKGLIFTHLDEAEGEGWKAFAEASGHKVAYVSAGAQVPGRWEAWPHKPAFTAGERPPHAGRGFAEMRRWV